jgi:hypothetical protein
LFLKVPAQRVDVVVDADGREPATVAAHTDGDAMADDGRACALEYNVVAGREKTSPAGAGIAVCVRGDGGRLAAVRIYDDVDPLSRHLQEQPRTESRDAPCMSR